MLAKIVDCFYIYYSKGIYNCYFNYLIFNCEVIGEISEIEVDIIEKSLDMIHKLNILSKVTKI